jgi:hypothetical protein
MQYVLKNTPKLTLAYLLRRRKILLNDFILNRGIKTYGELDALCASMGCSPPDEETYLKCLPVEKKEITDNAQNNKKKRKLQVLEEVYIDATKSDTETTQLVLRTISDKKSN